jgi:hypothetical protein
VTWNLEDFPKSSVGIHGIEVWTPDDLLMQLLAEHQDIVIQVIREHRASLKSPPKSAEDYLDTLSRQKLYRAVAALKETGEAV